MTGWLTCEPSQWKAPQTAAIKADRRNFPRLLIQVSGVAVLSIDWVHTSTNLHSPGSRYPAGPDVNRWIVLAFWCHLSSTRVNLTDDSTTQRPDRDVLLRRVGDHPATGNSSLLDLPLARRAGPRCRRGLVGHVSLPLVNARPRASSWATTGYLAIATDSRLCLLMNWTFYLPVIGGTLRRRQNGVVIMQLSSCRLFGRRYFGLRPSITT